MTPGKEQVCPYRSYTRQTSIWMLQLGTQGVEVLLGIAAHIGLILLEAVQQPDACLGQAGAAAPHAAFGAAHQGKTQLLLGGVEDSTALGVGQLQSFTGPQHRAALLDGPQQGGGPGSKERARVDQADPDIGAEGMGDLSRHRSYLPFQ